MDAAAYDQAIADLDALIVVAEQLAAEDPDDADRLSEYRRRRFNLVVFGPWG
jgi:hypothetical protein